jgi:hypothetical protein
MSMAFVAGNTSTTHKEADEMSNEKMAERLNAIGQYISAILNGDAEDSYLYAEATDGSVEGGIFQDKGREVIYHDPNTDLAKEILELWYLAEPGKEWGALHYDIKDGRFDARFEYPDAWDPEEFTPDRRERALKERFGDKPVIYPPPDEDFQDLTEADLPGD